MPLFRVKSGQIIAPNPGVGPKHKAFGIGEVVHLSDKDAVILAAQVEAVSEQKAAPEVAKPTVERLPDVEKSEAKLEAAKSAPLKEKKK